MSVFTPSGSGGAVATADIVGATNPTIAWVSMPVAGTEYSYTFPTGTKQFRIRPKVLGHLQVAYAVGQSGTLFADAPRGCFHAESGLNLTAPLTVYFQSDQALQTAEIILWT